MSDTPATTHPIALFLPFHKPRKRHSRAKRAAPTGPGTPTPNVPRSVPGPLGRGTFAPDITPSESALVAWERARRWLEDRAPICIEGQDGSRTACKVARVILHRFGLSEDDALALMIGSPWNQRCIPSWEPDGVDGLARRIQWAAGRPYHDEDEFAGLEGVEFECVFGSGATAAGTTATPPPAEPDFTGPIQAITTISLIAQALADAQAQREEEARREQATPIIATPHEVANMLCCAYHNHDDFRCSHPLEFGLEYTATGTPFIITKRCEKRDTCRGCRLWYNHCRMLLLRRMVGEWVATGQQVYERYIPLAQWDSLRHLVNDHDCQFGRTLDRPKGYVYVLTNDPDAGALVDPEIGLAEAAAILAADYDACNRAALVTFSKGWGEAALPDPEPKATFVGEIEPTSRAIKDAINEQGDIIESVVVPQDITDPVIRQRIYRRRGGWTPEMKDWFWDCHRTGLCLPFDRDDLFNDIRCGPDPDTPSDRQARPPNAADDLAEAFNAST